MLTENYLVLILNMLPYDKIAYIIVELLKRLAIRTDNQLDDMLVNIIENILHKSMNCGGIKNDGRCLPDNH